MGAAMPDMTKDKRKKLPKKKDRDILGPEENEGGWGSRGD